MSRGTSLSVVREMLKAELGQSLTVGTSNDTMLNIRLDNQQNALAVDYDWSFMDDSVDVNVGVATQTVVVPTGLNWDHEVKAFVKRQTQWVELEYGISEADYSARDSSQGVMQDPIQKWQLTSDGNIEVWPLPATAQDVRFRGQRAVTTLKAAGVYSDAALFDLDDLLIVLFVAGEMLLDLGKASGQLKLQRAAARLAQLRANVSHGKRVFNRGGNSGAKSHLTKKKVVLIA